MPPPGQVDAHFPLILYTSHKPKTQQDRYPLSLTGHQWRQEAESAGQTENVRNQNTKRFGACKKIDAPPVARSIRGARY